MAYDQRSLDDYIDVAQRIADFRERFPDGTLQPADPAHPWEQAIVNGVAKDGKPFAATMIVYTAAAYRTPDDPRPGIGVAWEIFPGRTPYTLGSELQNAETSAWGRAIIAVGASDSKRGIASREEVRNRQAERDDGLPANRDGSLSRSRTTDEQKAAAGVMTDAEQRAHNQLAKPPANSGKVERIKSDADYVCPQCGPDPRGGAVHTEDKHVWPVGPKPDSDLWYDNPAPLADLTNPEDRHGTATADQIRSLQARMTQKGIGAGFRAAKIAWLVERFGAGIHSSKDLSYTQAAQALQELSQ